MSSFLNMYINTNLDIICFAIRIVIGIMLFISARNKNIKTKKYIVIIYYGLVFGCILGCLLNPISTNIIIGGIAGIVLSLCALKFYKDELPINFILFFVTIYEIIETLFYNLKINFSEILKTYDDI